MEIFQSQVYSKPCRLSCSYFNPIFLMQHYINYLVSQSTIINTVSSYTNCLKLLSKIIDDLGVRTFVNYSQLINGA